MRRIQILSPCYTAWLAWTYDTSVMTKSVTAEGFLLISPNKQRTGAKEKQEEEHEEEHEEENNVSHNNILGYTRISWYILAYARIS